MLSVHIRPDVPPTAAAAHRNAIISLPDSLVLTDDASAADLVVSPTVVPARGLVLTGGTEEPSETSMRFIDVPSLWDDAVVSWVDLLRPMRSGIRAVSIVHRAEPGAIASGAALADARVLAVAVLGADLDAPAARAGSSAGRVATEIHDVSDVRVVITVVETSAVPPRITADVAGLDFLGRAELDRGATARPSSARVTTDSGAIAIPTRHTSPRRSLWLDVVRAAAAAASSSTAAAVTEAAR